MSKFIKFIFVAGLCLSSSLNALFDVTVFNVSEKTIKVKIAEYFPDKTLFWGKDLSEKSVTIDPKKSYTFNSDAISPIFKKYSGSGKICMTYYPVYTVMPQKIWKGYQYTSDHSVLLDGVSKEVEKQIKKDLEGFKKKKNIRKKYRENLYTVYIIINKDLTCSIDKDGNKSFWSDLMSGRYAVLVNENEIEGKMDQD